MTSRRKTYWILCLGVALLLAACVADTGGLPEASPGYQSQEEFELENPPEAHPESYSQPGDGNGAAISNLLVGVESGDAPGATLYYTVTGHPQEDSDAIEFADTIRWILEKNKSLPREEKIKVVSISGGPAEYKRAEYVEAVKEAKAQGVQVLDGVDSFGGMLA